MCQYDSNMRRIIGVTFATEAYEGSAAVLRHSALTTGEFDEFRVFGKKDIQWLMDTYPNHFESSRGWGWWAWKPFLIRNVLDQTSDGDIVVYVDSTMVFERSILPYARHVALEYQPILLCRLGNWSSNDYRNRKWTKKSVFNHMKAGDVVGEEIQLNAAFQVYRNGPDARAFVSQYLEYCLDLDLINDSGRKEDAEVVDTRHDQSILSIMASEHPKVTISRDVTQWGKKDPPASVKQPTGGIVEIDECDENGIMHNLVDHHRRTLQIPKIAVITPTLGGKFLEECIKSVQKSTLPNIEHWVVVDGKEHEAKVNIILSKFEHKHPIVKLTMPKNIGSGGWNGHRVFGSVPWMIDCDYIAYLDDDNVVTETHYADLVRSIVTNKSKWAYCLRYLMDASGKTVGYDNCESLGGISHSVAGRGDYLIDTSCYMVDRDLAIMASPVWNAKFRDPSGRPEPDRELCKTLLMSAPHSTVRKHSLGYRLGSTGISVAPKFFEQGNKVFGYDFAKYDDIYIFHFSQKATDDFLKARLSYSTRSYALDEWQMTLLKGLDGLHGGKYNLLNGFSNFPNIPTNATVLVSLCNPGDIPFDFLEKRQDLHRIVYTLESPNIRHSGQWNLAWLNKHFDVALTYFEPLLKSSGSLKTVFSAHNCHHGCLDDPLDRTLLLRTNKGSDRSVGLVLERRPELMNKKDYAVNGVHLKCLDYLREDLVIGLSDVTVFGMNWSEIADGKNIKLGHGNHRSKDSKSTVDHKENFVFDLVVENCDAPGYVSEKFYDALSAGCVPLYYGNMFEKLSALIPEGHDGVYFDLKKRNINTGEELQKLIDSISDEQLTRMRENVVKYREDVLRFAGTRVFAKAVENAIVVAKASKKSLELV
jgi:glycosyltransferase involved in cell wall biosynthesis